jgi:hypothetical protein
LQAAEIDLAGREAQVARFLSPEFTIGNDGWDKLDAMLEGMLCPEYRNAFPDSFGNGWIFNWFCVDHVGYVENPRRRDIGYHNIFDHYRGMLKRTGSDRDGLQFHYHPMPFDRKAHHCATRYLSRPHDITDVLARRIIDRHWFPHAYRPGFDSERPDSHWFLEQYIPFDYANQATTEDYSANLDVADGRFGDWRRAPQHWQPYHPAHDDYQSVGHCRRWIARCLKWNARVRSIQQEHVDGAFEEAASGKPVVLAFADHDFRDMMPTVAGMHAMLTAAAERFPAVKFRYCNAREAMRSALGLPPKAPCQLTMTLTGHTLRLDLDSPSFGPQPFLAIRSTSGDYFHDNLDCQTPFRSWTYVFDEHSFDLHALDKIGAATCDATGNVTVAVLDVASGGVTKAYV